jgi:Fe2+ transport system protein B
MILITRLISVLTTAYSIDLIPLNTWLGILIWLVIFALVVLAFYFVNKYSNQIDGFIKQGWQKHKRCSQKGKDKQKANKT